jgi:ADP-ribose pyrophosphatase
MKAVNNAWKVREKKTIHNQPPWLVVEHHTVELPDGRVIPEWPWLTTPDYVNVICETTEGIYLMFRQAKYGLPDDSLAPVGGYLQPGEAPLAAAQRELLEETGYQAQQWIDLGHYLVDPNRGIATGHLYLARQSSQVAEPVTDDLEDQRMIRMSRMELETALDAGEIKVLAWAAAAAFALRKLPEQ